MFVFGEGQSFVTLLGGMSVGMFQLVINLLGYCEGHGHVADND